MDPSSQSKLTIAQSFSLVKQGYDIEWHVKNETGEDQPLPPIEIGPFPVGSELQWMDFTIDGSLRTSQWAANYVAASSVYPRWLYSPVIVASNRRDSIGCSLNFPILEYQHDVACSIEATDQENEWVLRFSFTNADRPKGTPNLLYPALVGSGSERTYQLTVRASNDRQNAIETLAPYRAFFNKLYGGTRYQRDPRPVRGDNLAFSSRIDSDNPSGFVLPTDKRPDLVGFGPIAKQVERLLRSWSRVVLWAPSGANAATGYNYPFLITSRWLDEDVNAKAMNDAVSELSNISVPENKGWGLWWGHSIEYQTDWDSPDVTSLDLEAPVQVQAAFSELDRAAAAGATIMGLDAFSHRHLPVWKSYHWLERMQQRQPSMTFVTEGCTVDIMHTLAPTWIDAYPANALAKHRQFQLARSHALADLLLPGHEIWAGMLFNRLAESEGKEVPLSTMRQEIVRLANFGYIPVIFVEAARPTQSIRAAKSWAKETQPDNPPSAPSTRPAQGTDSSP